MTGKELYMPHNSKGKKSQGYEYYLSMGATWFIIICFLICCLVFIYHQYQLDQTIQSMGKAVLQSVEPRDGTAKSEIDYVSAMAYIEAIQQAYSENSAVKLTSLIYALVTTVILGYGTRLLRLGDSDKAEIINEIRKESESKFSENAQNLSEKIMKNSEEKFKENASSLSDAIMAQSTNNFQEQAKNFSDHILFLQNDIFNAIIACKSAINLCLLLRSLFIITAHQIKFQKNTIFWEPIREEEAIENVDTQEKGAQVQAISEENIADIAERLQIELTNALSKFNDILHKFLGSTNIDNTSKEVLKKNYYELAKAVEEYLNTPRPTFLENDADNIIKKKLTKCKENIEAS